jgi:hypothetical protein
MSCEPLSQFQRFQQQTEYVLKLDTMLRNMDRVQSDGPSDIARSAQVREYAHTQFRISKSSRLMYRPQPTPAQVKGFQEVLSDETSEFSFHLFVKSAVGIFA